MIYIGRLSKVVVKEIRSKYIVQLVLANESNFKRVGELIKDDYLYIIWISYTTYYITMIKGIGEINKIK